MWEHSGSFRKALFDWHKSPMSEPAEEDGIKIRLQVFYDGRFCAGELRTFAPDQEKRVSGISFPVRTP